MKSQPKRSPSPRPTPAAPPRSSPSGFRPRRILVTTDFSPASLAALPHAAALAEQFGAEVALLHVVEPAPRFVGMESLGLLSSGDAAIGRGYGELDALAKESFRPAIRVKTYVRTGRPFQEINRAASELDAGLIVIATHGHTGLKHTLLGSTAERVLRRAPCPVLTVKSRTGKPAAGQARPVSFQSLLMPTDFSTNAQTALPLAHGLADACHAPLTLLHVVERYPIDTVLGEKLTRETTRDLKAQAQQRLAAMAAGLRARHRPEPATLVRFGTPVTEITRVARTLADPLIVIATHGYTGLKHAFLGSVAERVVRHAHCPVLVVRSSGK